MMNLKDTHQHVHFVGIGGVGVSAIAEILHYRGFTVSGSDAKSSKLTENLEHKGIAVTYGHSPESVEGAQFVVYTTAVNEEHPELARAIELGIPCIPRPDMLGELMKEYEISIAVSGAHGKTTTSSMLAMTLVNAGMDPTVLVGGEVKDLGTNARVGESQILVAEACEYKESFLSFHPTVAVLLNIDEDHLDYYEDIDHIVRAFKSYVMGLPKEGILIYNGDDPLCVEVAQFASCDRKVRFGLDESYEFYPSDLQTDEDSLNSFSMVYPKGAEQISLSIPGLHNVYNAMAAFAAAYYSAAPMDSIADQLSLFTGAARRFDVKGTFKGAKIIDDYAHHPSEVIATLKTAKSMKHNKIICVFQPHTYTRTLQLMEEFTTAFKDADEVIITDIYAAREKDDGKVHSKDLVAGIEALGQNVKYYGAFEDVLNYLEGHLESEDVVFTMGAGSISELGPKLLLRAK